LLNLDNRTFDSEIVYTFPEQSSSYLITLPLSWHLPGRKWPRLMSDFVPVTTLAAVVKDISVWTVGPRHSVNFINCTD